jgi:hypothetical protein
VGNGSAAACGQVAVDHRVSTSSRRTRASASRTASSKPSSPSGGSGTHRAISCSRATTSVTSERTSGRAMAPGTGVTTLIQ